ncbi:hypothetical protein [Candidatus Manganitrophus noduliformans]|uniref:Uncharacterized protein n=1 Tax=Candidatus Manganitrophus noduliformans TaxID=2606439 RepID=A0A7X6DMZ5_9BACT|nr:hypothetical protein [Candidatus Manganitrophus noduliformans]NKE69903.1 hypothetical protein [Candidatus Manganitrophus noduliformans]
MKRIAVKRVDTGIVSNSSASKVVWSRGRNVRFRPGSVYKTPGKTLLTTVPAALSIRAMKTFKGHDGVVRTVVACDNKIFSYTGGFTEHVEITPTPAPTGTSYVWHFELIGGMLIVSNGFSRWKWPNYAAPLQAMTGAPEKFGMMTVSNNRLIVGNITDGGNAYPARVKWSQIGKPEIFTIDKTGKGGRHDLLDPNGKSDAIEIPKAATHRGKRTIIYTERNIWALDPVEFPLDYRPEIIVPGLGLLAPKALVSWKGIDYIMGPDDFYMMGSGAPVPFGFDIRPLCFNNLNKEVGVINTAFGFVLPETQEIGFAVPSKNATEPDTIYLYHLELKKWTPLSCNFLCVNDSRQDPNYGGAFGGGGFGEGAFGGANDVNLLPYTVVGNIHGQILKFDEGFNDNGEPITGYIESGDMEGDSAFVSKVTHSVAVYLKEQSGTTEPLMIQIGVRDSLSKPLKWSIPKPFAAGIDEQADITARGKWMRIRFYSDQMDSPWELEGYELLYSNEEEIR